MRISKLALLSILIVGLFAQSLLAQTKVSAEEVIRPDPHKAIEALQKQVAQNKTRVQALEIRVADLTEMFASALTRIAALERGASANATPTARPQVPTPADVGTEVYTLDREHLRKGLRRMTLKSAHELLQGKTEAEAERLLKSLDDNQRQQVDATNLRLILRPDRSMKLQRSSESGEGVETGLWSRKGNRLMLTTTHRGSQRLKIPELQQVTVTDDGLEFHTDGLPFPIRLRLAK